MTELQSVIDTLDNAADSFDGIATKEQKKIYDEVITLAKDLDLDAQGKVKQSIANLKRLTEIKARLAALSKDKEWVASISGFAKYFGILQQQQNAYYTDHFPSLTLSKSAKQKHALMKQLAVQNTMEALMGSGLKANVTDKLNDILLRAVTTNAKFADLQEELRAHLLGKDGGQGAFSRYATTYATTALSQFTGQNNKLLTDDLGCEWFMYTGSNKETTREFCEKLTEKKYIHRSEIPTILTGRIDDHQCAIYEKTGLPYGMIEGTTADNFQCNCGGWNCRHQLVPIADAVVPAVLRAKFAKDKPQKQETPTPNEKTKQPIDLTPYQEQISAIEQYIADHPKSAKIKGYLADINGAADMGDEEQLKVLLQAAKKDIAKFNAAKNSVAKKKAAIEQAKADQLSAANAAQLQAAKDYAMQQANQYGSYVAFADLLDKQAQALQVGDPTQAFQIANQIDELAKNISALDDLTEPMKWAQTYSYEELKQANDYVKGHIQHWKNKGKSGEQLIATISNEMDNFLDKSHKTYEVVHNAFGQKIKETLSNIEKVKFNENNDIIHQYTIDHPKSAKIKNYYDQIIDFEFQGKHDEAVTLQAQALADIKKFNAAAKSVANKKTTKTTTGNAKSSEKALHILALLKAKESVYHHIHKYADIEDALKKGNIERATRYINDCLKKFLPTFLSDNSIPRQIDMSDIGGNIQMTALADVICSKLSSNDIKKLTKLYESESAEDSDSRLRSTSKEQWKNLSTEEKLVITKYTQTYSYLNEPLRNITYKGNRTRAEYERDVAVLTNALTKCRATKDMVVRKGTNDYVIRELMKNLSDVNVGDKFTDGAFLSTSVHKQYGFYREINLIIYVPKGSMGFYVEPASHFTDDGKYTFGGDNDGKISIWDGKAKETLEDEREWIGQRGSRFEVVKKQGKNIYLKLIGQLYKQP